MAGQLKQLLIMAVFGFCFALVYDLLRASRRIFVQSIAFVSIQDILFWLICAVCMLMLLFRLDYGEIRGFMFLGTVIGAIWYFAVISPVFLKITLYALNGMLYALRLLLWPFRTAANMIRSIFEYFVNFIKKHLKKLLIYGKIRIVFICRSISIIFRKH